MKKKPHNVYYVVRFSDRKSQIQLFTQIYSNKVLIKVNDMHNILFIQSCLSVETTMKTFFFS